MEGIFGCMAMILSLLIATGIGIIATLIGSFIARKKQAQTKPISIGLLAGLITFVVVFCITSWFMLSKILAGPASPFWEPSQEDIIGIWHLTEDSNKFLQEEGYVLSENTLEFRDDGTFLITNMPKSFGGFESESGTWEIDRHQSYWVVGLHTKAGYSMFWIHGESPPYRIYETWGELGPWIFFERHEK